MHENGRETYGHSIIISPWGEVIAEAGEKPCIVSADIDLAQVKDARTRIPALNHVVPIEVETVACRDPPPSAAVPS
jgi:predicted amidohydrolase